MATRPINYKFRVFDKSHGKVKVIGTDTNQLQLQCLICNHKYWIKASSVKDIPCKACIARVIPTQMDAYPYLTGYLHHNLKMSNAQIANFFQQKPKQLPKKFLKAKIGKALRVLTFDPGSVNFGCFVGDLVGNKKGEFCQIKPLESRMLMHTFSSINNLDMLHKIKIFNEEIIGLAQKYKPQVIMIERFQSRGKFSSNSNEVINLIIGIMLSQLSSRGFMIKILPPSTWKNAVNRIIPLDNLYKEFTGLLPHQLDTALMAISLWPSSKLGNSYQKLLKIKFRRKLHKRLQRACWQLT